MLFEWFSRQAGAKGKTENEQEKYFRLFLVVNKNINEEELREEFSQYGEIDYASVIRDRGTGQSKGFAYVKFKRWVFIYMISLGVHEN